MIGIFLTTPEPKGAQGKVMWWLSTQTGLEAGPPWLSWEHTALWEHTTRNEKEHWTRSHVTSSKTGTDYGFRS